MYVFVVSCDLYWMHFSHCFRKGSFVGNRYGSGPGGSACLNYVVCAPNMTSFSLCKFKVSSHEDPTKDVSISCSNGMSLTLSVTVTALISIAAIVALSRNDSWQVVCTNICQCHQPVQFGTRYSADSCVVSRR